MAAAPTRAVARVLRAAQTIDGYEQRGPLIREC
jgi:hypothetical protein